MSQIKMGTNETPASCSSVPTVSQYLKVSPSTVRFHMLVKKGQETGQTWQEVARQAIDWYLLSFPPKKSSKKA